MDLENSAKKLRHAAERHAKQDKNTEAGRRQSDSEAAEVHGDLTAPEHSKGRPRSNGDKPDRGRPSNAGTDGP